MSGAGVLKRFSQILSKNSDNKDSKKDDNARVVPEAIKKLSTTEPLVQRLQFVKEFAEVVRTYRVEDVNLIFRAVEDLFQRDQQKEGADVGFHFLQAFIEGQYGELNLLRPTIFLIIKRSNVALETKLDTLKLLTKEGRDIHLIEREIGGLILQWLSENESHHGAILNYLACIFKYNFAILDESSKAALTKHVCLISNAATSTKVIETCLSVFDVIVRYGTIPNTVLHALISSLCRIVNIEVFSTESWKTMANVLRSHCGHDAIKVLCNILQDMNNQYTVNLLRGALFFVGMSVWGSQRITSLNITPVSVLPSILAVLQFPHNQPIVAYEVLLAVGRLIKKYGNELRTEWEILIPIIARLKQLIEGQVENTSFVQVFGETVSYFPELITKDTFFGNRTTIFQILEETTKYQTEQCVLFLLDQKIKSCQPYHDDWLNQFKQFLSIFFLARKENRQNIRLKALMEVRKLYASYKDLFAEEMEKIIFSYLHHVYLDEHIAIRQEGLEMIIEIAHGTQSPQFQAFVDIIDKAAVVPREETQRQAVLGLIYIFRRKFHHPHLSHLQIVYKKLVQFLYSEQTLLKKEILPRLLQLRANRRYQVIFEGKTSMQIRCHIPKPGASSNLPSSPTNNILPIVDLYNAMLHVMQQEAVNDAHTSNIFQVVVLTLIKMLRNRHILIGLDIGRLAHMSVRLFSPLDPVVRREDALELGYHLMGVLVAYHSQMPSEHLKDIASTFVTAINARWPNTSDNFRNKIIRFIVGGLSQILFEFPADLNTAIIPKIVESLSQLNTPIGMQASLEYLILLQHSVLLKLTYLPPTLFEPIFRLTLAVIEAKKTTPYCVGLAYKVLLGWFSICPLSERHNYFKNVARTLIGLVKERNDAKAESYFDLILTMAYGELPAYPPAPLETPLNFSETAATKYWIQGNSLMSIRSGSTRTAILSVRRPSSWITWPIQIHQTRPFQMTSERTPLEFPELPNPIPNLIRPSSPSMRETREIRDFEENPRREDMTKSLRIVVDPPAPPSELETSLLDPAQPLRITKIPENEEDSIIESARNFQPMGLRTNRIPTPSLSHSPVSPPLYMFYPPLPSYDEISPSPKLLIAPPPSFPESSVLLDDHLQLNLDGQLLLHSGSPPPTLPEAAMPAAPTEHSSEKASLNISSTIESSTSSDPLSNPIPTPLFSKLSRSQSLTELMASPRPPAVPAPPKSPAITPQFVLLQLHPSLEGRPRGIRHSEQFERAIAVLDKSLPFDTHKIGILYVAPNQTTEEAILSNQSGSHLYLKFLAGIGKVVNLKDWAESGMFTGGFEGSEADGEASIIWRDFGGLTCVMFHIASMMPNLASDTAFTSKKALIGNDCVSIVFSDHDGPYHIDTLQCQFNLVNIVVSPVEEGFYRVDILRKADVPEVGPILQQTIVSQAALIPLVRATAVIADSVCHYYLSVRDKHEVISNPEERLRQIKSILKRFSFEEDDFLDSITSPKK